MRFIADFHLHSKYSRATSKNMDLENLAQWAKIKGIKILGTGDFTQQDWFKNLKEKLEPAEPGLFRLKNGDSPDFFTRLIDWFVEKFIWTEKVREAVKRYAIYAIKEFKSLESILWVRKNIVDYF